jgi:hypothetical protein
MLITSMLIAMLAPGTVEAPATAPRQAGKLICKRFEVTGSVVKKERVCYTRAQWSKVNESHQKEWSAIQGTLGNTRGD